MAEEENKASLEVVLEDGVSGPSETAAAKLSQLSREMKRGEAALAAMNSAQRKMKAGGQETSAAYATLTKRIADQKKKLGEAQAEYVTMGGTFARARRGAMSLQDRLAAMSKQVGSMPGPLGQLGGALTRFVGMLDAGKLKALALGAAVVGLVAITAKAARSLLDYVVGQGNARRSELLRLEGLSKMRTMLGMTYGMTRASGAEVQAAIDRVSASVAISRDKVADYARQLQATHVRAKNLVPALMAVAQTASAQGEAQASMAAGTAAYLQMAGGSVDKFAARVQSRLGGIVAKQMLDSEVQAQKLGESYGALTTGLDVEPLLKARKAFNDIFSQSTASGRALKDLLDRLMPPFVKAVVWAQNVVTSFFEHAILFGLQLENVYLSVRLALAKAFDKGLLAVFDGWLGFAAAGVLVLSGVLLTALVPAIWAGVVALGSLAAAALTALAPLVLGALTAAAPILVAVAALWGLFKVAELLYVVWKEIDWSAMFNGLAQSVVNVTSGALQWGIDIAKALFDGIVQGIKAASSYVLDALTGVAGEMKAGFMHAIGAASPSKVFAAIGRTIPQGLEVGIKAESPRAQDAADSMIAPDTMPTNAGRMQSAQSLAAGGGARNATVHIDTLSVSASGGDAKTLAQDIKRELERVLEGVALQMGAQLGDEESAA